MNLNPAPRVFRGGHRIPSNFPGHGRPRIYRDTSQNILAKRLLVCGMGKCIYRFRQFDGYCFPVLNAEKLSAVSGLFNAKTVGNAVNRNGIGSMTAGPYCYFLFVFHVAILLI